MRPGTILTWPRRACHFQASSTARASRHTCRTSLAWRIEREIAALCNKDEDYGSIPVL
ncbi:unnamed protein product [Spirodela intermedia]|uniref:Uncharacterized protein n=1 Tax=Spirodela intermedia TaxID=51605 RepID=A0ABN7EAK2_SPIIN|nr:unnamed protein product [Spirodela intermedia]